MTATPALKIPQVTQDDLVVFHARHFSGRQQGFPSALLSGPPQENPQDGDLEYDYNDGDGLGYYPDGVKRTLTDAQIEMFRWSEVQNLLRAKRRLDTLEEGIEKQHTPRKCPLGRGGDEVGARRTPGSKKRGNTELDEPSDKRPAKRMVYDTNAAGEKSNLNYDDTPHAQSRFSAKATLPEDSESEEEYERFLAREREELSSVCALVGGQDPDIDEGGLGMDSISATDFDIVEQRTPNSATVPLNTVALSNNGTTQPVHSRRRIFYGDDDSSDGYNTPKSPTAIAAGGITKGERRAFLWPKIGGGR